jgi:Mn2+/Fe2+ NRAMP family transporter
MPLLASSRRLMGQLQNTAIQNVVGWATLLLIAASVFGLM